MLHYTTIAGDAPLPESGDGVQASAPPSGCDSPNPPTHRDAWDLQPQQLQVIDVLHHMAVCFQLIIYSPPSSPLLPVDVAPAQFLRPSIRVKRKEEEKKKEAKPKNSRRRNNGK